MKIIVASDYEMMSRNAAQMIASQIQRKPASVLGLATGSTPIGTYRQLIQMYRERKADFSEVQTVNLDEYAGLPRSHPQSFRYFMDNCFFRYVNVKKENIHFPLSAEDDYDRTAEEYEEQIRGLGQIDMQILGIGGNGHIGFNEPADYIKRDNYGRSKCDVGPKGYSTG